MPGFPGASPSLYLQPGPTYLVGLPTKVTATEFTLEAAFRAVVLQVSRQITTAQLGWTAIGAGDYIEAASVQVALVGDTQSASVSQGQSQLSTRASPVDGEVAHSSGSPPHYGCSG